MLATLCSNPDSTNRPMQKKIARIFPVASFAAAAIQTARQTSQLHKIPRTSALPKGRLTFDMAVFTVIAPKSPSPDSHNPE